MPYIMVSHRPFQHLQPLSLLAQLISRRVEGCLQLVSGTTSWLLYLHEGKLAYATNSTQPLERLDRSLLQLSESVPALKTLDRSQLKSHFQRIPGTYPANSVDYQAICWLVEQGYLEVDQATVLIEELAKEVIKPLLSVTEGMYELIAKQNFIDYPHLCELDLRSLVEQCHLELRQRQAPLNPVLSKVASYRSAGAPASTERPRQSVATEIQTMPPSLTNATINARPPYTIACIDDSPTVLQSISAFLKDESVSVIMINDPVKALMQIVRNNPDLILLDINMPNLDGYELCALLRRHPTFKRTPIIMVTGHTGFLDRARAKLVGASGYLTKPFTQSGLVRAVFKFLA
jgi:twitching motility two-component system response regulator PilG